MDIGQLRSKLDKQYCFVGINCGGFSAPDFNTQSGGALRLPFLDLERRSESIFGIQSAPRFQAIYGVESVPRFQPIFGIQSAPLPLSS